MRCCRHKNTHAVVLTPRSPSPLARSLQILPEWLLVVSLVILLGYTAQTTLDKGLKVYQKETEAQLKAAA